MTKHLVFEALQEGNSTNHHFGFGPLYQLPATSAPVEFANRSEIVFVTPTSRKNDPFSHVVDPDDRNNPTDRPGHRVRGSVDEDANQPFSKQAHGLSLRCGSRP